MLAREEDRNDKHCYPNAEENPSGSVDPKGRCLSRRRRVTGINLNKPLDDATIAEIQQLHAEHGVFVFPNQKISGEDLKTFGRYFGKLTVHPFSSSAEDNPELIVYDQKEGNPPPPTDIWHTDETFRESPHGHGAVLQDRPRWEPNMLVFWDNRWTQHSALHDYYPKRRLMERITIKGDRPIGDAKPADPFGLRRYLSPPVMEFEERQKCQHEM